MIGGGHEKFANIEHFDETTELVVSPRAKQPSAPQETRHSLNNMTKRQICDKSAEMYGVDLEVKTEKKLLITQYLEVQNKYA